jgi:hypothetical protein
VACGPGDAHLAGPAREGQVRLRRGCGAAAAHRGAARDDDLRCACTPVCVRARTHIYRDVMALQVAESCVLTDEGAATAAFAGRPGSRSVLGGWR